MGHVAYYELRKYGYTLFLTPIGKKEAELKINEPLDSDKSIGMSEEVLEDLVQYAFELVSERVCQTIKYGSRNFYRVGSAPASI